MKYKTKPIDYTGCNEIIAEHLKRGEKIFCKVWDSVPLGNTKRWISSFHSAANSKYDLNWINAEPITTRKRIMPPERAMPVLIAEGFVFNSDGDLAKPCSGSPMFYTDSFHKMGKIINENDPNTYPPCIIEEVDE